MKKRSLFAAVAMLIVSAIVLTSATYAWFTSNDAASVGAIQIGVSNTDGNLRVAASGTYAKSTSSGVFKTSISSADYENLPATLVPVSFNLTQAGLLDTTNGPIKVSYSGEVFGPETAASTDYLNYSFQVEYKTNDTGSTGHTVTLTPQNLNRGGGAFVYFYVEVSTDGNTTGYLYGGDSYEPVTTGIASGTTVPDVAPRDAILGKGTTDYGIDDGASAYLGSAVTAGNPSAITLWSGVAATETNGTITPATKTATVNVYIWAEGNDADCTGAASANNAGIEFTLGAA